MKRFGISFAVKSAPSPRRVDAFSGSDRKRYLSVFKPLARQYRRRRRIALLLVAGFILACAVLAQSSVGNLIGVWGLVVLLACWVCAVVVLLFGLRLKCPGCGKPLMPATGRYCPNCGSEAYDQGRHLRGSPPTQYAYCPFCDSAIYDGRNDQPRTYGIRGCTHCGVMLDEIGV